MPQYRDLHQSGSSKKLPLSDRMKKLIQKEKDSYKNPICEFCDDCGEELIGDNYYPITNLKHSITTENEDGSAVLCPKCYKRE